MTVYGDCCCCVWGLEGRRAAAVRVPCWSSGALPYLATGHCGSTQYSLGDHPVNITQHRVPGAPASQTSQHLQHNLQFRETGLGCHPAAFMLCNFYTGWLAGQWTIFPSLSSQSIATFTVNWYEVKCVNFSASLPAVITGVNMNMKLMLFVVISVFIMRLTETNVNWDVKYVHLKLQGVSPAQQDWG